MSIAAAYQRLSRPSKFLITAAFLLWPCWHLICLPLLTNSLIGAVHGGNTASVRLLLALGADPNRAKVTCFDPGQSTGPWTPLETAAYEGRTDIVKIMLAHGANINLQDKRGDTPLTWALLKGPSDTIPLLLHSGADVRLCDIDANTPLNDAAARGDVGMLALFIHYGADVNAIREGKTPLEVAVSSSRVDSTRFLLAHGAKSNIKCSDGSTLLQHARQEVADLKGYGVLSRKMKSIVTLLTEAEAHEAVSTPDRKHKS